MASLVSASTAEFMKNPSLPVASFCEAKPEAVLEFLRSLGPDILANATHLDLCHSGIDDRGLVELSRRAHRLEGLKLMACEDVTDTGIGTLTSLTALEDLDIPMCSNITDKSLESLAKMTQLKWLDISHTRVSDRGMAHLSTLTGLETLFLGSVDTITDSSIAGLRGLTNLSLLRLRNCCQITDDGVQNLANFPKLRILDLTDLYITDKALSNLTSLTNLYSLSLRDCWEVTTGGLSPLLALPNLKKVDLKGCAAVDVASVKAINPRLFVTTTMAFHIFH